jgi:hypothetical protein
VRARGRCDGVNAAPGLLTCRVGHDPSIVRLRHERAASPALRQPARVHRRAIARPEPSLRTIGGAGKRQDRLEVVDADQKFLRAIVASWVMAVFGTLGSEVWAIARSGSLILNARSPLRTKMVPESALQNA